MIMWKKLKGFLRATILVSFFVFFVPFSSFALVDSAEVSIDPDTSYILTGGAETKFSVDIVVDENTDSLVQCEIYLRCDKNVLAVDSVSRGSIWQGAGSMMGGFNIEPTDSNQVFLYYSIVMHDLYVNGPGVLATVHFRVRGSGESDLIFPPDSVILRGLELPVIPSKAINGKVYVDFPPTSFNLLSPSDGENLYYCLGDNHLFDWENSTTPYPGNNIYYSLYYGISQNFDLDSTTIIDDLGESQYEVLADSFADSSTIYWKVKAYDDYGFEIWSNQLDWSFSVFLAGTDVETPTQEMNVISNFSLLQNHPNPFNPTTHIDFDLVRTCQVRLEIYNILGNKVKTLINDRLDAGPKSITWDGKDDRGKEVASGIYFYRLKAGDFTESKKMVIIK
jgi:hypothetical protein